MTTFIALMTQDKGLKTFNLDHIISIHATPEGVTVLETIAGKSLLVEKLDDVLACVVGFPAPEASSNVVEGKPEAPAEVEDEADED